MRIHMIALVALGLLASCARVRSCLTDNEVATLQTKRGQVEQQISEQGKTWTPANAGASFSWGDAIRTGEESRAQINLVSGGSLFLGEKSAIRFLAQKNRQEKTRLRVETGVAEILGGGSGVLLETEVGLARIERGSRIRVDTQDKQGANLRVLVGAATVERVGASPLYMQKEDVLGISLGRAVIEPLKTAEKAKEEIKDTTGLTLLKVQGNGVQIKKAGEPKYFAAVAGDYPVKPLTEVRIPTGASVHVSRGAEQGTIKGSALARVGETKGPLFRIETGSASVGPSGSVSIALPGGSITAKSDNGRARANVTIQKRGLAAIVSDEANVDVLGHIDRAALSSGESVRLTKEGHIERDVVLPKAGDFAIRAGEVVTIHDPNPPTALRLRFKGVCPGAGVIEASLGKNRSSFRSRGDESALIYAPVGTTTYRVRCGDASEVRAQGSVRVLADAGRAELPQRAPRNTLEADGRPTTVLYQNLLPEITFRWKDAQPAKNYTLRILSSRGKLRSVASEKPQVSLKSGDLTEASYEWWFENLGGPHFESLHSRLTIRFDNAAPSAEIRSPVGTVSRGAKVNVIGVVSENSRVSIGGVPVALDGQNRFRASVLAPTDENTIAIRISHPQRGTHYYLRRVSG